MWCPAWQRGAEKERHTVSVWATLVMPETPTKRERQSLPVAEARGSQQVYSLALRPTS